MWGLLYGPGGPPHEDTDFQLPFVGGEIETSLSTRVSGVCRERSFREKRPEKRGGNYLTNKQTNVYRTTTDHLITTRLTKLLGKWAGNRKDTLEW